MARSDFDERRGLHFLSATVFGLLAVCFGAMLIWHVVYGRATLTWPSTRATYLRSVQRAGEQDSPPLHLFEYEVAGTKYRAGRYDRLTASPIYYSPSNPAEHTWSPGVKPLTVVFLSCMSLLIFVPAVLFALMGKSPDFEAGIMRALPFRIGY